MGMCTARSREIARRLPLACIAVAGATFSDAACSTDRSSGNRATKDSGAGAAASGGHSGGGSASGGWAAAGGASAAGGAGGTAASSGASGTVSAGGAGAGTGGRSNAAGSAGSVRADGGAGDPCATAGFCEDFESYPAGSAPGGDWKAQTSHGAVSVVEDQRFGGLRSAKFTTEATTGGKTAFIRLASAAVFPVPGNVLYGRMMFRLESAPETSVHWTFIQAGGTVSGQTYHALYRYGGQHPVTHGGAFVGSQLMANYETPDSYSGAGPSSDCWHHAKGTVAPVNRWACVEGQVGGPNDALRLLLGGSPPPGLNRQHPGHGAGHPPPRFR